MNDFQSLNLNSSQSLVMSPKMQQAIKILQMNNLELSEYIENEFEKNPFISIEHFKKNPSITSKYNFDDDFDFIANVKNEESIYDNISAQIDNEITDRKENEIAKILIQFLDERGFLNKSTLEIAENCNLSFEDVEKTIKKLQDVIEPTGIFSRNIEECIKVKLQNEIYIKKILKSNKLLTKDECDDIVNVAKHMNEIFKNNIGTVIKNTKITKERIIKALKYIKKIGIHPNFQLVKTEIINRIPDVIIKKNDNDDWRVELNNETLPKILIEEEYYSEISKNLKNKEEKTFVKENFSTANWLKNAVNQRANTILKIAKEILYQQKNFFENGTESIRSLTLKDIADEIGVHESTVSRATSNKFIETDFGIFEFKYFFSSHIETSDGKCSSNAIKEKIFKLISNEDKKNPYSDEIIVSILSKIGINIARRTVAKYRESIGIESSQKRKLLKILY